MTNQELENRLIDIEMIVTNQERVIDDLNQVIISQGKELDVLKKQTKLLLERMESDTVKPQSEETPPPHY